MLFVGVLFSITPFRKGCGAKQLHWASWLAAPVAILNDCSPNRAWQAAEIIALNMTPVNVALDMIVFPTEFGLSRDGFLKGAYMANVQGEFVLTL